MIFKLNSNSVNITPTDRYNVSCEIDCDTSEVIEQIMDNVKINKLLENIDISDVISYYGKDLLNNFDIDDILKVFSIEDIIKYLGEDSFRDYIRDVMIDKII